MAWKYDKQKDEITIYGFEQGIAPSPHKGIGNMQGVNISTETGEIMCSFARTSQLLIQSTSTTGTLAFLDTSHLTPTVANNHLQGGMWITVTGSTHGGELANGDYYVLSSGAGFTSVQLATSYGGSPVTGFTSGLTASFTLKKVMGKPLASATEKYSDGTQFQFRYYILDNQGLVWVLDTGVSTAGVTWFLPDIPLGTVSTNATGIAVLNGWLHVLDGNKIWCKPTVWLGGSNPGFVVFASGYMNTSYNNTIIPHFAFVGHQGVLYYTDGNFLGSIFPNTSLATGATIPNIQSYCQYTSSGTSTSAVGTVSTLISGSNPVTVNGSGSILRVPVVFFAPNGGALPSAITADTIYWIQFTPSLNTFQTYAASSGGSALDTTTGASGTQFFNTYYPTNATAVSASTSGQSTITFTPQRLNLPTFEIAQCMGEIGNLLVVGGTTNALYPWSQVNATPDSIIPTPENNCVNMITVNNMLYVFMGQKGNIYICNGSAVSPAFSVPDYTAGIAGTPSSYIEPYFTWGGAMFLRGRVWFSILDQTSSKTGNCGGIWSFVPTNNLYIGQDQGLSLRLENQSSYGTYSGYSPVLIPAQTQTAVGPQYWNAWQSSISSPTYGIDTSGTFPATTAIIDCDLIPTGTMETKKTIKQQEYKMASPLLSGESIQLYYRLNATDAWTSCGTVESDNALSGIFKAVFEKTQWLQIQAQLIPNGTSTFSGNRLAEIIIR